MLKYVGLILVLSLFTISDAIAYKCNWNGRYEVIVSEGKKKAPAIIELNYIEGCTSFKGKMMNTSGLLIYRLEAKAYSAGVNNITGNSWTVFKGKAEYVNTLNHRLNLKAMQNKQPLIRFKNLSIRLFSNPFGKIIGSIGNKIRFEGRKVR